MDKIEASLCYSLNFGKKTGYYLLDHGDLGARRICDENGILE